MLKSSYRKIWSNILTARWRASAWSDKMNKEQSGWWSLRGSDSCKNDINSTISMSYPDVVIACIEHKVSLEDSGAIEAALWSTIIIWRIIPWWLTDHHNCHHLNYLVCDRESTRSPSLSGKAVKTATQLAAMLLVIANLQYRPVRREERGTFILQYF